MAESMVYSVDKGKQFFGICPKIPVRPWFENCGLHRKLIDHTVRHGEMPLLAPPWSNVYLKYSILNFQCLGSGDLKFRATY